MGLILDTANLMERRAKQGNWTTGDIFGEVVILWVVHEIETTATVIRNYTWQNKILTYIINTILII